MRDTNYDPEADLYDINRRLANAAGRGDMKEVESLQAQGANPTAYNCYALRLAADAGQLDMVRYLVEEKGADPAAEQNGAFWWAAQSGFVEVCDYLFDRIPDKQKPDLNIGMIRAAGEGFPALVAWYHKRGANLKADSNEALNQATLRSRDDVVKYLVENGVSLAALGEKRAAEWTRRLAMLADIEMEPERARHGDLQKRLRRRKPPRLGPK